MNPKSFLTGLAITTLVQLFLSFLLSLVIVPIKAHVGFILATMVAMILFCLSMYVAARIMAQSSISRLYIQLIMIAVFVKMLLCLVLVMGYKNLFHPADQSFLWPFLIIYLTSTIYEVIFLEKVGRQKQKPVA